MYLSTLRKALLSLSLLALALPQARAGERRDELAQASRDSLARDTLAMYSLSSGAALRHGLKAYALPLIGTGIVMNYANRGLRNIRHQHLMNFKSEYDDFLQFVPWGTQLTLHTLGVKGRSESTYQLLTADALSFISTLAVVQLGKTLTKVQRPDGSAHNSFPSGHTAMAFAGATVLSLEYGKRYPWLGALGYASAAGTGLGRVANNRHWIGDVVTGAGIGIFGGLLGYYLSDAIYGKQKALFHKYHLSGTMPRGFTIGLPISNTFERWIGDDQIFLRNAVGLSLAYYFSKPYYLDLETGLAHLELQDGFNAESYRSYYTQLAFGRGIWAKRSYSLSLGAQAGIEWLRKSKELIGESFALHGVQTYKLGAHLEGRHRFGYYLSLRTRLSYDYSLRSYSLVASSGEVLKPQPHQLTISIGLEVNL